MFSFLCFSRVLNKLNISWNEIGPTGAAAIAEALRGNEVLKALYIGGNELGDEGAKAIRDAVSGREAFTLHGCEGALSL